MRVDVRELIRGLVVACLCSASAMAAATDPATGARSDYDIRRDHDKAAAAVRDTFRTRAAKSARDDAAETARIAADLQKLAADLPFATTSPSTFDAKPDVIAARPDALRPLTAPQSGSRVKALRDFMQRYPALYGVDATQAAALAVEADYTNPDGNLSWVTLQQRIHGVPVFQGEVRAGFTHRGELIRTVANLASGVDEAKVATAWRDPINAVAAAARSLGYPLLKGQFARIARNAKNDAVARFERGPFVDTIEAERLYFPVESGVLRPAWRVLLWERELAWYVIVDAADDTVLWRKNLTSFQTQSATFSIYAQQNPAPLSPSPAAPDGSQPIGSVARTSVTPPVSPFNNLGWITDGNNTTDGNNVEAGIDIDGVNGVDPAGRATGVPFRVFNFPYDPYPGVSLPTDASFRQGAVTNMFYWANVFHDRMYDLGFTELARNFQHDNFGRGATGNDRISAEAQDSGLSNNANFATPADGGRGRYQASLWTATTPDLDGALDQDVLLHEFTHGMSERLIGNGAGLDGTHANGLGEGWSDCAALFLQARAEDDLAAVYPIGEYSMSGTSADNYYYGIRRFPYARMSSLGGPMNRPHNPLTFADIDPTQVSLLDGAFPPRPGAFPNPLLQHNVGEIWCSALFEIHALMVEQNGFTAGNRQMLQIMIDGMKLVSLNPDFLDARDAFLAAAASNPGLASSSLAWRGFATRGMGFGASVGPGDAVVESFETPLLVQTPALSFNDDMCNGNGTVEPGDRLLLDVPLTNISGNTIIGATMSLNGSAPVSYGTLANGAVASRQIGLLVPYGHICGMPLPLTFAIDGSGGASIAHRAIPTGFAPNVLQENFDTFPLGSLAAGWSGSSIGVDTTPWTAGTLHAVSAPHAAVVSMPASVTDNTLIMPLLPASAHSGQVRFSHRYAFENGFDGGVLEISIGGGAFADIIASGGSFEIGGYNGTLNVSCGGTPNPLASRQAWTGTVGATVETVVNLPAIADGETVRLRWRAGSDCSVASVGWSIDDVRIDGYPVCEVSACMLPMFEDGFETP